VNKHLWYYGVCIRCHVQECDAGYSSPCPVEPAKPGANYITREEKMAEIRQSMPEGSEARKGVPLCTGVLDYFPAALAAVAKLSKFGNDKHNPGEPLHWARGKSMDHADCIMRHLADRGVPDPETKMSHTVEVAWRALALLQEECEAAGAPRARGAW